MIFDTPITANQIVVDTYYKCCSGMGFSGRVCGNIVVTDISDLLIGGTVTATVGDDSSRNDWDKDELVLLINAGGFSFTAP